MESRRYRDETYRWCELHSANEDALSWLTSCGSWQAYEKKKIRIVHASLVQIDVEMAEKYAKQQRPVLCSKFAFGRYCGRCVSPLVGLVWPWPLTLQVMAPVADAGHRPPSVYQVWSCRPCRSENMACVSALIGLVTLTDLPDLLTLKLVCESHQRWGTFIPNLGMLGLRVLELFAMYVMDGWTDGRTKAMLIAPYPTVGGVQMNIDLFTKMIYRMEKNMKTELNKTTKIRKN